MSRVGVGAGGRKLWKCNACGLVSAWTDSWVWFGALRDEDEKAHETLPTFCCRACADASGLHVEPVRRGVRP